MGELSHRERVEMALNHEEPDRVPIEFGGADNTIYEAPSYWPIKPKYGYSALVNYLGLKNVSEPQILASNCVASVDERILDRFGSDFVTYFMRPLGEIKVEADGTVIISWGVKAKMVGYYWEPFDGPLRNPKITFKDIDNLEPPNPEDPAIHKYVRKEVKELRERTHRAIVGSPFMVDNIFHQYTYMRGFTQMMLDMKKNPEIFLYLADTILDVHCSIIEAFFSECGDYVDFALLQEDLGTQQTPFFSPEDYKKYIKPYHKGLIDSIKSVTDAKIYFHSCGAIFPLIEHLIDIGVDVLNPIQPLAKGMDAESLKKAYGNRLTFCGGIDAQKLLPNGTPQEIEAEVKRVIEILGKNGGYILAPSHNLQGDVPPQNVVAMFDAALKYGKYR
ncbi:MAG: uroporphyrinogen decarboxylase family protein [Candidatus Jordarchaeaceae archaeon]